MKPWGRDTVVAVVSTYVSKTPPCRSAAREGHLSDLEGPRRPRESLGEPFQTGLSAPELHQRDAAQKGNPGRLLRAGVLQTAQLARYHGNHQLPGGC